MFACCVSKKQKKEKQQIEPKKEIKAEPMKKFNIPPLLKSIHFSTIIARRSTSPIKMGYLKTNL